MATAAAAAAAATVQPSRLNATVDAQTAHRFDALARALTDSVARESLPDRPIQFEQRHAFDNDRAWVDSLVTECQRFNFCVLNEWRAANAIRPDAARDTFEHETTERSKDSNRIFRAAGSHHHCFVIKHRFTDEYGDHCCVRVLPNRLQARMNQIDWDISDMARRANLPPAAIKQANGSVKRGIVLALSKERALLELAFAAFSFLWDRYNVSLCEPCHDCLAMDVYSTAEAEALYASLTTVHANLQPDGMDDPQAEDLDESLRAQDADKPLDNRADVDAWDEAMTSAMDEAEEHDEQNATYEVPYTVRPHQVVA